MSAALKGKKSNNKEKDISVFDGFSKFMDAIEGHTKDVSVVLRCHLLCEYYLDQIISIFLPRGDKIIDGSSLSFFNKLSLVQSFDVVEDHVITAVINLNKVRNKCSHELIYSIPESDVDLIGRPFGVEYTKKKAKAKSIYALLENVLMSIIARLERCHDDLANIKKRGK